ncbi:hypothetical protein FisN_4Lh026 [Fistulifera solaris]|uniref:Uncharacterized protein n=1 Tax=Fistulifera solaris TaxID=1519565 RepID=A0A1Z5KDU0_FISSO|nr:hypothetical protein FisN_4Lh026 [Fistulifera solaris]|eukprot:GAX24271.1 hypothetical protein FisN_4Lh026 [Fistulifera solaris]
MEQQNVYLMISKKEFIDVVAASSKQFPMAVSDNGFWADQWTYYMDLVNNFLSVFPDWEERLMYEYELPYFFSPFYVKPREEKYVLSMSFDGRSEHVRQLDCVREDEDKVSYMKQFIKKATGWYDYQANWQHNQGDGSVFKSAPIAKLFLLATLKFTTRDAMGMGIEYEAGKPGWNDANNGLVGMLGSGMPETYELVVLLKYIRSLSARCWRPLLIPCEIYELFEVVNTAISKLRAEQVTNFTGSDRDEMVVPEAQFRYWERVSSARERYRSKTKLTFEGSLVELSAKDVVAAIDSWLFELNEGIARSFLFSTSNGRNHKKVPPTYFFYTVTEWKMTGLTNHEGHALVQAEKLRLNTLPLFLEGPTRYLSTVPKVDAYRVYEAVHQSPLRDKQLNMYTISTNLNKGNRDLGRDVAFPSGWLKNQSVWMHLSYKLYLQFLRHDMFEEFFHEMASGAILPFIQPEQYGRSVIEASSFIVSSAFEDPSLQGRGFLARLSGTTTEFLSIWTLLMIGPTPFFTNPATSAIEMHLLPALPRWLFLDYNDGKPPRVSFKLFGSITITYFHQRGTEDLYRIAPSSYQVTLRDDSTFNISGSVIPASLADKVRRVVFVASIDVYFQM